MPNCCASADLDRAFVKCELSSMDIATFRREVLGVSQEAFGRQIGLNSKSSVSEMERDNRASARVALAIERISNGMVRAEDICPAVALIRSAVNDQVTVTFPQQHVRDEGTANAVGE